MKNLRYKITALVLCMVCLFSLAGCGQETEEKPVRLTEIENKQFVHEINGMALTLPKDWRTVSQDDGSAVFANPEGTVSMVAKWELGGFSYFSQDELEEIAADIAKSELTEPEIIKEEIYDGLDFTIRTIAKGRLTSLDNGQDTAAGVVEVLIISPMSGIRYYIVTTASVDAYEQSATLFEDIYQSFYVSKKPDDLYKMLGDRETAAQTPTEDPVETKQ